MEATVGANGTKIAGWLLALSAVTHVTQLAVYDAERALGPAAFGVAYLVISIGLLTGRRWAPIAGTILPTIGGIGGIVRFIWVHTNPFSVLHVAIDLVVIPLCWKAWRNLVPDS